MSLFDWRDKSKSLLLSAPTPTTFPSSLEFDPDLTIRNMGGYYMQVHRGLIRFIVKLVARIYNPTTRQLVILPAIESDILVGHYFCYKTSYFMVHEPIDDQYKLLCTVTTISEDMEKLRSEGWVFVLEAGGLWKKVAKDFHPHVPITYLELIMNGVLYYLAFITLDTFVLVSFDFKSEEFKMIQVPSKVGDSLTRDEKGAVPIEYGGKVVVFDMTCFKDTGTIDLWIVEDWSKNEWSMKTLVVKPSQMNLVNGNNFMPKGTTLSGKVILAPRKLISPFYFLYYDLQINDLQKVEIRGIPDPWSNEPGTGKYFDMRFMDPSKSIIRYLET